MRILVTGGSGFVGKSLALKLLELGHEVTIVSRTKPKNFEQVEITWKQLDLASDFTDATSAIFSGVEAVFHVAAKVDMWGDYQDFYNTNVLGTKRVVAACKKFGIKYLVYTSSPSVVADGKDLCAVDESYPMPLKYKAYYPQTKAEAEKFVLTQNCAELRTIALRPHLIFGPEDQNLVPTIIERAEAGRLVQIGNGENLSDFCYIDDCVVAHVKALEALENNAAVASGKAYFISQAEPWSLWEWINTLLELTGREKVTKKIPYGVAYFLASILEYFHKIFLPNKEPLLTRFLICEMATSHYFNISAARNDLGFRPKYRMREALELTAAGFKKSTK